MSALRISDMGSPGAAYVHFDHSTVITEVYTGLADVRKAAPVDAHTSFHGFSVTKTITALTVLQLVRQGRFALDDLVKDLLPSMPYAGPIRVRHLLCHQAGLPNPLPLAWVHAPEDHAFDRDAYFAKVFQQHPRTRWAPGERFAYSNLGYVLLGQLIERVCGVRYEQVVRDRVLAPAAVANGSIGFQYPVATHATGYLRSPSLLAFVLPFLVNTRSMLGEKHGPWRSFKPFLLNGASYGGTLGTANGYRMYLQTLMHGNALIDDAGRALLFMEQRTNAGKRTGMAHGWFTGALNGERYVAHAGGGGGYYAELRLYPDRQRGSVLMLNRTGIRDERLLDRIDPAHLH